MALIPPVLSENPAAMSFPFPPQAGGSTGLLMDLAANEKAVHADFFNGKDAGIGWPVLICFFCKLCRGAAL